MEADRVLKGGFLFLEGGRTEVPLPRLVGGRVVFWFCSFLLGVCKKHSFFCYHTKSKRVLLFNKTGNIQVEA